MLKSLKLPTGLRFDNFWTLKSGMVDPGNINWSKHQDQQL